MVALVIGSMLVVDLVFLASNATKILAGGWFPLLIGSAIFTLLMTWKRGRALMFRRLSEQGIPLKPFLEGLDAHPPQQGAGHRDLHDRSARHGAARAAAQPQAQQGAARARRCSSRSSRTTCRRSRSRTACSSSAWSNGFFKLEAWYGFKEQPDIDEILNSCRVRYGLALRRDGHVVLPLARDRDPDQRRCRAWRCGATTSSRG